MNIALLQTFYKTGDPDYNAEVLLKLARSAAKKGADLCVAPELAICGPLPKDLLLGAELLDSSRKALAKIAEELKNSVPLLIGSPVLNPVPVGRPSHNCAVLINNGDVRIVSRKVLLSSNDVFDEHRYFEPGMASGVFDLNGWRIAVVMAEDTANDPSFLNRAPTNEGDPVAECLTGGADALICLGAIPFSSHYIVRQENILASIAARYRIPTVFVNHAGAVDGNVFPGMSSAFDYTGNMVALGALFDEDVVMFDLAREYGQKHQPPSDPLFLLWNALVLGTRHFVSGSGNKHVFLGMSGGMDSALAAAIAAEALGPENVTAVFMPSPYTSEQSEHDADAVVEKLGINYFKIPITPIMECYEASLAEVFSGMPQDVTEENIQARIRANILMAMANKKNGLVLCTSNKSELSIGYGTIYGDLAGAFALLGDVYKTQVFNLARWYNTEQNQEIIPESIINKEPSAELKHDQKDSDSLPPYEILDAVLESYIEKNLPASEIVVPEVDGSVIAQIIAMFNRSEFKRAQAPPVIRVSIRGFGFGWRMPVTK